MKKFLLIAVTSLVLFVVGVTILSLGVTKPITNASEMFFQLVKEQQVEKAYAMTSRAFQQRTDQEAFLSFIEQSGLASYKEVFWEHRAIHNTFGDASGILTTAEKKTPIEVQLVYEEDEWKIQHIKTDSLTKASQKPKLQTENTEPTSDNLPPRKELRQLVTSSVLAFNDAVAKKDFTDFHNHQLAELFKKEFSAEKLKGIFSDFIKNEIDLSAVKETSVIFDETPLLIEDVLILNGYYLVPPRPIRFKFKYVQVDQNWKLTALSVNTADDLRNSVEGLKIPQKTEQEQMVKATLLDFDASVQLQDFKEFHAKVLSTPFQLKFTPEQIKDVFQPFIDKNVRLDMIEKMSPIFDKKPEIDTMGFLVYKGRFKTSPSQIFFSLEYVYEEDDWKLADLHINLKKPAI